MTNGVNKENRQVVTYDLSSFKLRPDNMKVIREFMNKNNIIVSSQTNKPGVDPFLTDDAHVKVTAPMTATQQQEFETLLSKSLSVDKSKVTGTKTVSDQPVTGRDRASRLPRNSQRPILSSTAANSELTEIKQTVTRSRSDTQSIPSPQESSKRQSSKQTTNFVIDLPGKAGLGDWKGGLDGFIEEIKKFGKTEQIGDKLFLQTNEKFAEDRLQKTCEDYAIYTGRVQKLDDRSFSKNLEASRGQSHTGPVQLP